jgi:hypothetical protein
VQRDAVEEAAHLGFPRHFSLARQFLQEKRAALSGTARWLVRNDRYFDLVELPLLLGELLLGELLEPLLLGELLDPLLLGELLEPLLLEPLLLGEELEPLLLGELDELPPVAPLLEPDFLKCASHSERDTCPSLFLSTVVNSGVELDAPLELLPPLDMPLDEPLDELPLELGLEELLLGDDELPPLEELLGLDELPLALGEDLSLLELLPVALGDLSLLELEEPELCAMDTLASAKSAAAVAVVISFNFIW